MLLAPGSPPGDPPLCIFTQARGPHLARTARGHPGERFAEGWAHDTRDSGFVNGRLGSRYDAWGLLMLTCPGSTCTSTFGLPRGDSETRNGALPRHLELTRTSACVNVIGPTGLPVTGAADQLKRARARGTRYNRLVRVPAVAARYALLRHDCPLRFEIPLYELPLVASWKRPFINWL